MIKAHIKRLIISTSIVMASSWLPVDIDEQPWSHNDAMTIDVDIMSLCIDALIIEPFLLLLYTVYSQMNSLSTGFFYSDLIVYTVENHSPLYTVYKRVLGIVQEWGPEGAMVEPAYTHPTQRMVLVVIVVKVVKTVESRGSMVLVSQFCTVEMLVMRGEPKILSRIQRLTAGFFTILQRGHSLYTVYYTDPTVLQRGPYSCLCKSVPSYTV